MSSMFSWSLLGRQLLQQLMHELFSEIEMVRMMLPDRPELEGIDVQISSNHHARRGQHRRAFLPMG